MDLKKLFPQLEQGATITIQQRNRKGSNEIKDNQIANQIINLNLNVDANNIDYIRELLSGTTFIESSKEFKVDILAIEKLISDGKTNIAIDRFNELLTSNDFNKYSKDEKFLVYNGILNCHVNKHSEKSEIEKWSAKIEALDEVKEIYRYYYLKAIWKYNNKDFKVAKTFNNQALKSNPEYIKALSFDCLIRFSDGEIAFEDAKQGLEELLDKQDLKTSEIATIYGFLGDVAFNGKKYKLARDYYEESNNYVQNLSKEIGYAICVYHISIKEIKPDNRVDLQNIDFRILNKSKDLLEKIYSARNDETLYTISRMALPYLFNIYSLTGEFGKTIDIYGECNQYIDYENVDVVKSIVQAQVTNKIFDEEMFKYLDEYDSIKYKSFYFERCEDYEKQYEVLVPAIEGKYCDDKLLQLSMLNCLFEQDKFDYYMYYYKKFSKNEVDEVLWLNYIEYLDKQGREEVVVDELKKIKNIISNALIINGYLRLILKYNLGNEIDEFFDNIDSGRYPIIDTEKSYLTYQRLMYQLKIGDYKKYYALYEELDFESLKPVDRWVLTVNYHTCKGDFSKCAEAYFELYKVGENTNDLLKAIQLKINANEIPAAEYYLEYANPMELKEPEYYYMYSAVVLKERGRLKEAFAILDEYKEHVKDLDSPYHQFYSAFNMTNGRTDEAVKYMVEYHAKNPNPKWFKTIQHSENDTGEELLRKIEELVGGRRDLTELNYFFNMGVIGVSVYEKLGGKKIEEMVLDNRYPFTKLCICTGDVRNAINNKSKMLTDKLLVDVNTLTVLSIVNSLDLLNVFDEIYICYNSMTLLKQMESELTRNESSKILDYIEKSVHVKTIPMDISLAIKDEHTNIIPEDTLNCIALSEELKLPFLNVEVSIYQEYKANYVVDMNVLFFFLKEVRTDLLDKIAIVKMKLKRSKFDFISFDADDIVSVFKQKGVEGIISFIRMDKNSNYQTYLSVYMSALISIKKISTPEDFEIVASHFIRYYDKYLGKIRYYLSNICRGYLNIKREIELVIKNCNILMVLELFKKAHLSKLQLELYTQFIKINIIPSDFYIHHNFITRNDTQNKMLEYRKKSFERIQQIEYTSIIETNDFKRVKEILSVVSQFFIQFISAFGTSDEDLIRVKNLISKNLQINTIEDVNYLIKLFEEVKNNNLEDAEKKI